MGLIRFFKELLLDGKNGLLRVRTDQRNLSVPIRERIEQKNAVTNVKRIVPFSALIFLIEILNLTTIFATNAYPSLHAAYLTAGIFMLLLTAGSILMAYRALSVPEVSTSRCKLLYRCFWLAFSLGMLVFICLELSSRGLTNNFFYLLILTAAFPLLSWGEALCLFGLDAVITIPAAVCNGFSPQQLLQLPLITLFALILSRVLYNSHRMNDITLERLEISNQKLAALAQTDPLTGLLNRRGLQDHLKAALAELNQPCDIAFLMIDIDLFKSYNDRFGHSQGDQCLCKVAEALQRCVYRHTDLAARIGGEEFLVALVGCDLSAVIGTAQRLRREVLRLEMTAATNKVHRCVTVSVGVAATRTPFDFATLYGQADKALYLAKNAGRNCVALGDQICGEDAPSA